MTTPTNLMAMRLRMGCSLVDAARICGLRKETYEPHERENRISIAIDLHEIMAKVEDAMDEYVAELCQARPQILLTYSNHGDFSHYDPVRLLSLKVVSVHRMACAHAQYQIEADTGFAPPIVMMVAREYQDYCATNRIRDSHECRMAWAAVKLSNFRISALRERVA